MKNKKRMALALISVLSLSALTLSVFADPLDISNNSQTAAEETQKNQPYEQLDSEESITSNALDDENSGSETGENTKNSRGYGRHHGKHDDEQIAEPENAIGKDAAQAKALEDAGVTAEQAGKVMVHLSQLDDGTVVYKVHFICDNKHYLYQINATSGEITDKSSEAVTEGKMEKSRGHGRHDEEQISEPENAIGKDAAQTKALEDAGVTAEQAGKVMVHLSQLDDGTVVYKVHFICDNKHYLYQINATSGEITDKNSEAVTEGKMEKSRVNEKNNHGKEDSTTDSSTEAAFASV